MVLPQLEAISKALARPEDVIHLSAHTAELLDVYRDKFGAEMGMTVTREQALERLVQVFVGNPLAAQEARAAQKPGAANG